MAHPEPKEHRGWRRLVVPCLVVGAALAVYGAGALRARAQGTPTGPAGRKDGQAPTGTSESRALLPPSEIQLTPAQERALDVKTVRAARRAGDHPLVTGGKVSLDLERTARVRPLLNSIIFEVKKHAGDAVKKGDELLVVESTDLGDAKNNYLTALANLEVAAETYRREALIRVGQGTTETDYHNARAAFRNGTIAAEAAREKCLLLGVSGRELEELEAEMPLASGLTGGHGEVQDSGAALTISPPDQKTREEDARAALREISRRRVHRTPVDEEDTRRRARYTIRAPIDGILIAKDAARGEFVDPSQVIATVSDVSQVWINLDVYQSDIPKVRIGALVDVTTPAYPDTAFVGSVTFLSETVDDTTHALKARVVVDNTKHLLKSGMAARTVVHCADLVETGELAPIELPPSAIIHEGQETYVIIRTGPGHFARRKVALGLEAEDAVHVDSGVAENDEVVLEGNLFIHTEIPLGD
jgi:multidrug efflux pump subunit AcrA (membrane-fusion protein)